MGSGGTISIGQSNIYIERERERERGRESWGGGGLFPSFLLRSLN